MPPLMRLLRGLHNIPADFDGCVATIGNFDGVHLGHQRIIESLKKTGVTHSKPSLVIIFEPQPKEFFASENMPTRLTSFREKCADLAELGVDYLLCLPFNNSLRSMTANEFIARILVQALQVKHLIVGDDFRFGCDRRGDFAALQAAGDVYGFAVEDTPTQEIEGKRVSSTRIREELAAGRLAIAASLLGHRYRMQGRVIYGRQLGRTLDTPTANVRINRAHNALPLTGVFAVAVRHHETGEEYLGVANVGVKPTVTGQPEPSLEVHLFGFDGDVYGDHLTVEFMHKIRDEKKFSGLDELRAAIDADKQAARAYFAAHADSFRFI
ncbi:MAG: bifunctional riboflavin kinase/FAD synthetase [Oleibacter sp.]|nr:bifunctional riboflavin kinase/FAD synthetase [Thalassolituus sp.]